MEYILNFVALLGSTASKGASGTFGFIENIAVGLFDFGWSLFRLDALVNYITPIFLYISNTTQEIWNFRYKVIGAFIAFITICGYLLGQAIVLFFIFSFFFTVPVHEHVSRPVFFHYDQTNIDNPTATLVFSEALVTNQQAYKVQLALTVPESPQNFGIGMFMIHSNFSYCGGDGVCVMPPLHFTQVVDGHDGSSTVSRSSILIWKSPLQRLFYTVFYAIPLVLGIKSLEEKQYFDITLFENYICQIIPNRPYLSVTIELGSKQLQVYDATIQFTAQLSGFSYYLHYHYWATASIGVGIIFSITFVFTLSILLLVGVRAYLQMESSPLETAELFSKPLHPPRPKGQLPRPLVDQDRAFTFGMKRHTAEEDSSDSPSTSSSGPSTRHTAKTTVSLPGKGKEEIPSPTKPTTEAPQTKPEKKLKEQIDEQEITEPQSKESTPADEKGSLSELRQRKGQDQVELSSSESSGEGQNDQDKTEEQPDKDNKDKKD